METRTTGTLFLELHERRSWARVVTVSLNQGSRPAALSDLHGLDALHTLLKAACSWSVIPAAARLKGHPAHFALYHNATGKSLCLNCGTSPERIAAESLTRAKSRFVHGHISCRSNDMPQNRVNCDSRFRTV